MSITKGTLRTNVLEYMDASGAGRWDSTPGGTVDLRISSVFDQLWRQLLGVNRFYRVAKRTPTSNASGRYLLSDLNGGSGDSLQRLYRIINLIIDGREYTGPVVLSDWALTDQLGDGDILGAGTSYVWYQEGSAINALPFQPLKHADAVWVNWLPQRPAALSADDVAVDWPDGYEEILVVRSAARLLMKGGAETQASYELKQEIQGDLDAMMLDVARIGAGPQTYGFVDFTRDWGC